MNESVTATAVWLPWGNRASWYSSRNLRHGHFHPIRRSITFAFDRQYLNNLRINQSLYKVTDNYVCQIIFN